MQDINKMLGQTPETGAPSPEQVASPDKPKGDDENPLDKMSEVLKAKPKEDKNSKEKEFDEETIKQILMSGENTDGLFIPEKPTEDKEELHEEIDEDAKVKAGEIKEQSKKYAKKFTEDVLKNPKDYKVMTPKGEMTIAEAMSKGYNPITRRFDEKQTAKSIKEKHKKTLNEDDQRALDNIMNPANAQVAPADAEKYGIAPESAMVKQEQSSMPVQGQAPVEAMPPQGAAPAGEAPDLTSLLGGAK